MNQDSQKAHWMKTFQTQLLEQVKELREASMSGDDVTVPDELVVNAACSLMDDFFTFAAAPSPPFVHVSEDGEVCLSWKKTSSRLDVFLSMEDANTVNVQSIATGFKRLEGASLADSAPVKIAQSLTVIADYSGLAQAA